MANDFETQVLNFPIKPAPCPQCGGDDVRLAGVHLVNAMRICNHCEARYSDTATQKELYEERKRVKKYEKRKYKNPNPFYS